MPTYTRINTDLFNEVLITLAVGANTSEADAQLLKSLKEDSQPILDCMVWVEEDADMAAGRALERGIIEEVHRADAVQAIVEGFESQYVVDIMNEQLDEFMDLWASENQPVPGRIGGPDFRSVQL